MTSFKAPQLIFGCGGLGAEFVGKDATTKLLQVLKEAGISRVDTAGLYPPTDIGASQRLLGEAGAAKMGFTIDTKVLISMKGFSGTLRPDAIEKSLQTSLQALQFGEGQRINVYYPHAPDKDTPLEDQAHGFNTQYQNGHFNKVSTDCVHRYDTELLVYAN
jgi:aflatoxin B1 aldehyde reductase